MLQSRGKCKYFKDKLLIPLLFLAVFESLAIWIWKSTGVIFFLFNFSYIGTAVALGIFLNSVLPKKNKQWGRRIAQLLVSSYMLIFLGFFSRENMQIEGFFAYLMLGVFQAAVMHYVIAKIVGPIFFGRAWCGYACWTAMILELLPYKKPAEGRVKNIGVLRYIHFAVSVAFVLQEDCLHK